MESCKEDETFVVARCKYDGDPEDGELSFEKGERIKLLAKDPSGWWQGERATGQFGLMPCAFVRELMAEEARETKEAASSVENPPRIGDTKEPEAIQSPSSIEKPVFVVSSQRAFVMGCQGHVESSMWKASAGKVQWAAGLPVEVLMVVLDHLGPKDHVSLVGTCTHWRQQILKVPRAQMIVQYALKARDRRRAKLSSPKYVTMIKPGKLYLSGDRFSYSGRDLRKISGILTVSKEKLSTWQLGYNTENLQIEIDDWELEPISKYFTQCYEFIEKHKTVLVHCGAGQSRSPTIVLMYLMRKDGISLKNAFRFVRAKRDILPNEGFMEQLIEEEIRLFGHQTVKMEDFDWSDD